MNEHTCAVSLPRAAPLPPAEAAAKLTSEDEVGGGGGGSGSEVEMNGAAFGGSGGGGTLSPTGRGGGGSGDHQVLMLGVREGFLLEDEQLLRETSPLTPGGSRAWRGSATGGGNGRLRGGGKHVA